MENHRMTITEIADVIGVVPKTIIRWERSGKVKRPKRDWRGWRAYTEKDLEALRTFHDSLY